MGTFLFLALGLGFVWRGVSDLNEAVHAQSAPGRCEQYPAAASSVSGVRWVSLSGCRLKLSGAAGRRALRLMGDPTVVVVPHDPALKNLIDESQALVADEALAAFTASHQAELTVERLDAIVEAAPDIEGSRVLTQRGPMAALRPIASVLAGMALLAFGLLPVARRWRLENE